MIARPDRPAAPTTAAIATDAGTLDVTVVERAGDAVTFRVGGAGRPPTEYVAAAAGEDDIAGRAADVYRTAPVVVGEAETQQLTLAELAALNGGRLPLGVNADTDPGGVTVHTSREQTATLWLDAATAVPLDVDVTTTARSVADLSVGSLPLGSFEPTVVAANDAARAAQARAAGEHAAAAERADEANTWLLIAAAVAVLALAGLVTLLLAGRSARIERPPTTPRPTSPASRPPTDAGPRARATCASQRRSPGPPNPPAVHQARPTHPTERSTACPRSEPPHDAAASRCSPPSPRSLPSASPSRRRPRPCHLARHRCHRRARRAVTTIVVQLTAEGCAAPESEYPAGALMFEIENVDATAVTEFEVLSGDRILGEKENLPPGFSGSFSLHLGPGTYELYCPGADTERSEFTLVGGFDSRRRPTSRASSPTARPGTSATCRTR